MRVVTRGESVGPQRSSSSSSRHGVVVEASKTERRRLFVHQTGRIMHSKPWQATQTLRLDEGRKYFYRFFVAAASAGQRRRRRQRPTTVEVSTSSPERRRPSVRPTDRHCSPTTLLWDEDKLIRAVDALMREGTRRRRTVVLASQPDGSLSFVDGSAAKRTTGGSRLCYTAID